MRDVGVVSAVIYSAIYGGYDDPKPLPAGLGIPAYMFTDTFETAMAAGELGWTPRVVPHGVATLNGDPGRVAPMLAHKYWKTHPGDLAWPHAPADVDVAIWVDGSITIARPDFPELCLAALRQDDLALTPHPWRNCALAEGDYSATLPRYAGTGVDRQTEFYRSLGHPRGWGLFASGVLAWRLNEATRAFGRYWWHECLNWSHQDQVSLPVLLRLAGERQLVMTDRATAEARVAQLAWNANLPWEQWWTLNHHKIAP